MIAVMLEVTAVYRVVSLSGIFKMCIRDSIDTVVDLAADTAKETQSASARVKASANKRTKKKKK